MAVHQAYIYIYIVNAICLHMKRVIRISEYLITTRDRGVEFKPDMKKGLELYLDAICAGNWKNSDKDGPEKCLSRT